MMNTGKLAGRTLFITGGSRGIGKEIALKAAKDGANVVIAAKTANPHPKLPGTIYTAAKEIEDAGGKALPYPCDIRNVDQVQSAVENAVKEFGGIDIVVNNASAISLTSSLETDMKRYDLMQNINARGTFLTSKLCHPYLKKSSNPHILTLSPPLNMNPTWFENNLAYTLAKYGMSMCVIGGAAEYKKDGIAVNALWPRTMIETAASEMLMGDSSKEGTRLPQIMADAAYAIFCRDSKTFTGQLLIDEDVLKEEGMTDEQLAKYATIPGNTDFIPDIFMDIDSSGKILTPPVMQMTFTPIRKMSTLAGVQGRFIQMRKMSSQGGNQLDKIIATVKGKLNADIVKNNQAILQFNILSGDSKDSFYIDMKNGEGSVGRGAAKDKPDATFTMSLDVFNTMVTGKLKAPQAFMTGKMKISGDLPKAIKLDKQISTLVSN